MKKLAKFLGLTLAVVSLFSFGVGCFNNNPSDSSDSSGNKVIEETSKTLYRFGNSDYKIVLPENPTSQEEFAAGELNTFFKESTDYTFEIIKDTGLTYSADQKYLSLHSSTLSLLSPCVFLLVLSLFFSFCVLFFL